jgi:hypothetical protein
MPRIGLNPLTGLFDLVGTSAAAGAAGAAFTTIQTPAGTSPVASGATDTLTLTSSGATLAITGNSATDTVNFDVVGSALTGLNASSLASGTVPAARLPNPSASTLGGVQSYAAVTSQWITSISTSGVLTSSQPAFSDISGLLAASQLPNPSATTLGGVKSYAAVANQWINAISTAGAPSSAQPAFSNLSGSVAASQMPALTGDVTTSAGAVATTVASIQGVVISGTPAAGQVLKATSSTAALWENRANLSTELGPLFEDFVGGFYGSGICGTTWQLHYQGTGTGATQGANTTQSTAANPGVIELGTGTTTTGVSWIDDFATPSAGKNVYLGGGYTVFEVILKLSALSDATDTFSVSAGIQVGASAATSSDGIYFGYSHGTNSGNWVAYTSKSSANTLINSSVAASASAFQRLTWVLNSAGTSVEFFINGTSIGTTITNIPLSTTALRHFVAISKSAGTTSRSLYIDAIGRYTRFATAR